jgi:hypothetical protein
MKLIENVVNVILLFYFIFTLNKISCHWIFNENFNSKLNRPYALALKIPKSYALNLIFEVFPITTRLCPNCFSQSGKFNFHFHSN